MVYHDAIHDSFYSGFDRNLIIIKLSDGQQS